MARKAIWKGHIHFGAVNISVSLHTAVREERVHFHLLHTRDHARLRQQMVCSYDTKPAPAEEQTKGFEVEDGKYVIIDPEELEQAEPESSRLIEVREFVGKGQIDPVFIERVYYLEPEGPSKGYSALAWALSETDTEGVCSWTMRKRSYLGALQARGRVIRLHTLRYDDEVISVKSLGLEQIPVPEKELKIASDLIIRLSAPFRPEKFENEHQKKLKGLIDKKARGEKIAVLRPRRMKPTEPDKLFQALEASLKKVA